MKVCSENYRYNTPQFCGYRTLLGKRLDKVLSSGIVSDDDNTFLVNEINKLIQKRFSQPKNLGEGMQNRIYKLDDKYVIKVPINKSVILDDIFEILPQKFSELKTYYGEPLARIGNVKILKNVSSKSKAIPAGIPKSLPESFDKNDITGYYNDFYLPTFASVPQKSYDALARDIKKLRKMRDIETGSNYTFDYYNPNNVVLSGKTLKMTDDIETTHFSDKNTVQDMFNVFLKQINVGIPATPSSKLLPFRQAIAKKIIKAGMKSDLILTKNNPSSGVWDFTLRYLCNAKEDSKTVFEKLVDIKRTAKNQKELEKLTDDYLKELF